MSVKKLHASLLFASISLVLLLCVFNIPSIQALETRQPRSVNLVRIDPKTRIGKAGFFQVGKSTTGRWWLLDPSKNPFFYKGVSSVNRSGFFGGYTPGPYTQVVEEKYGTDPARFRAATLARLRQWNFNALGAWAAEEFWDQGMPYTVILNFIRGGPQITGKGVRLPDVFDTEWERAIDARAREVVAARRNSKQLVGYFTDNELAWGQPETSDRQVNSDLKLTSDAPPSLLQHALSLSNGRATRSIAWDFVLQRHGNNWQQLSQDWEVPIESKDSISTWTQQNRAIVSRGYLVDNQKFSAEFARRYFQRSAEAIRRYDPNHLILGCRFGAPPGDTILAAIQRPWVDVLSANNYRYDMYARIDTYYRSTQFPILIGEFSWGQPTFANRPSTQEPDGTSAVQRMARNGEQSLRRAFTHPGVVGYTWYRWVDLPDSNPPISLGLVDLQDQVNSIHSLVLTCVNNQAEAIALQGTTAAPPCSD